MSHAGLRFLRHAAEVMLGLALGVLLFRWAARATIAGGPSAMATGLQWADMLGALFGGLLGMAVQAARDEVAARRLIAWLYIAKSEDQAPPPPELRGFWGELAHRVNLGIREREARTLAERTRLSQFLSAIEASPNGVMILDSTGHLSWCSKAAANHFHLDLAKDRGQRITNLVRAPAFVDHLATLPGRQPQLDPIVMPSPVGERSLAVVAVRFGEGLYLIVSQDVTAQLRNESMRRDFVANVSHEIRTPLTVVSGFVEALRDLPMSEADRAGVYQHMVQQTQRMQALVEDLLTLARIEGSLPPSPDRWINLDGLVQAARQEAEALSAGRHVWSWPTVTPDLEIAGNDTELRSAVSNLLSNAVRYTPAGGDIQLSLGQDGAGRLDIAVQDTGPGIGPEHLPRITERFYRVDGSRSRATGGTGLGLAIVKHVVQRHGGDLQIRSEVGKGSCFLIQLPAIRVRRALASQQEPSDAT